MKTLLLDGDSLCYIAGNQPSIQEAITKVDSMLQDIFFRTEVDRYKIFLSEGTYFRHRIYPEYKAHRQNKNKPPFTATVKSYLKDRYNAVSYKGVEADDIVAYFYNITVGSIIGTIDSDLLKGIPGKNYDYKYNSWVETTEEGARKFFIKSLISGQAKDNIKSKFPDNCGLYNQCLSIEEVLHGYINGFNYETPTGQSKFKEGYGEVEGIYQFTLNYRLMKLLTTQDDYIREVGYIPELPEWDVINTFSNGTFGL